MGDSQTIKDALAKSASWRHDAEPIALPANDPRVKLKGAPITVPFRIVAEDYWVSLMQSVAEQESIIRRAHDAMSRRDPDGVPEAEWNQLLADMAKEVGL